jgi:putative endonuclease
MPHVYILFSPTRNGFYTGATNAEVDARLERHLDEYYGNAYTSGVKDWEVFLCISCSTMHQALKIERHIKNMKSKKYIHNLKAYPEMIERLMEKFAAA